MYSQEMLFNMTNRDLRDICADNGIRGVSKIVKSDLVSLILANQDNSVSDDQYSENDQVSDDQCSGNQQSEPNQFALVKYGCTQVSLPVGGMTIFEVVATYGPDIFNMPANVTAIVNGQSADGTAVIVSGSTIEFSKPAGKKGC